MQPWYEGTLVDIVAHLMAHQGIVGITESLAQLCNEKADKANQQGDPKEWRLWRDRADVFSKAVDELKFG